MEDDRPRFYLFTFSWPYECRWSLTHTTVVQTVGSSWPSSALSRRPRTLNSRVGHTRTWTLAQCRRNSWGSRPLGVRPLGLPSISPLVVCTGDDISHVDGPTVGLVLRPSVLGRKVTPLPPPRTTNTGSRRRRLTTTTATSTSSAPGTLMIYHRLIIRDNSLP